MSRVVALVAGAVEAAPGGVEAVGVGVDKAVGRWGGEAVDEGWSGGEGPVAAPRGREVLGEPEALARGQDDGRGTEAAEAARTDQSVPEKL